MGPWGAPVGRPVGFVVRFRLALAGHVVEISWVFRSPLRIPESVWENSYVQLKVPGSRAARSHLGCAEVRPPAPGA